MKKLDAANISTLKTRLEELPPRQSATSYEVVRELAEAFSAAVTRGYTVDDLVIMLAETGVKLSPQTVRNYLSRARREMRQSARANGQQITSRITSSSPSEGSGEGPRTTSGTVEPTADEPRLGARVIERARERARVLREAQTHETATGTVGRFELVPDRDV